MKQTIDTAQRPRAWAKSKDGKPSLSLVDHSIDVASIAEVLLQVPTIFSRLKVLAGQELNNCHSARLAFLIGLHDAGKACHGFQARLIGSKPDCGHIGPIWPIVSGKVMPKVQRRVAAGVRRALGHSAWRTWVADHRPLWDAILAHHGSLPGILSARVDAQQWLPKNSYDPIAEIASVTAAMRAMFPDSYSGDPDASLPHSPRFLHAFAGLVTLADWLGSDESEFPAPGNNTPTGHARISWARRQAADLVRRRWLDPTRGRLAAQSVDVSFGQLFPQWKEPRPSQEAMLSMDLPNPGQITILEAETGSGKTEAALILFLRLFQAGVVDGLYFALPTRAAAVQIHRRLQEQLKVWLGDASPPVGLAVPGYIRVDTDKGQRMPASFDVQWPDEADKDRGWAVEQANRYLAGAVMVGTVDQVLMGGLRVRHASLRSGLMLRLLLCIDEVHASDTYMITLMRNVLDQHMSASGVALLMSATLGSQARARLLTKGRVEKRELPTRADAASIGYPAVSRTGKPMLLLRTGELDKRVNIDLVGLELESLWTRIKAATVAGAAVLFIRNTVDGARTAVKCLEDIGVRVFTCKGVAAPHHGRFAPSDRVLLDEALISAFNSSCNDGFVAVTTQTAEQSLDICADWLITDLSPGDVLLQRIGRLHRHDRSRPAGFDKPVVTILSPTPGELAQRLDPDYGTPRGQSLLGLGRVYQNILGALAAHTWLQGRQQFTIPRDNRALVEASTHSSSLQELAIDLGGVWPIHLAAVTGSRLAEGQAAKTVAIRWEEPLAENQPIPDIAAITRLGLNDHRVKLSKPLDGPFGSQVRSFVIPGWMAPANMADLADNAPGIVRADGHTLKFRLGNKEFTYDRFGLKA